MIKGLISIIVPVYNSELYLNRCLNSVLLQSHKKVEIIIVNDGSTDASYSICKNYEQKDKRIKLCDQKNKGISYTREYAVSLSQGEYIMFIDSDDFIENNSLETLYTTATELQADILISDFYFEQNGRTQKIKSADDINNVIRNYVKGEWAVLWRLFFKKDIIDKNNIHFPLGVNGGEDYYYTNLLINATSRVFKTKLLYYHYNYSNVNSFTHKQSWTKIQYQVKATILLENKLKNNNNYNEYKELLVFRKLSIKRPLLLVNLEKWKSVFPEVNNSWHTHTTGIERIKYFLLVNKRKCLYSSICQLENIIKYALRYIN
ncbi:glycosyltransferase family 2 protein [Phocaeicola sp.]